MPPGVDGGSFCAPLSDSLPATSLRLSASSSRLDGLSRSGVLRGGHLAGSEKLTSPRRRPGGLCESVFSSSSRRAGRRRHLEDAGSGSLHGASARAGASAVLRQPLGGRQVADGGQPVWGDLLGAQMFPPAGILKDWMTWPNAKEKLTDEASLDASVEEFFDCLDDTWHAHATGGGAGGSNLWSYACSAFSALTATSSLAADSAAPVPVAAQSPEYHVKAHVASLSFAVLYEDEEEEEYAFTISAHPRGVAGELATAASNSTGEPPVATPGGGSEEDDLSEGSLGSPGSRAFVHLGGREGGEGLQAGGEGAGGVTAPLVAPTPPPQQPIPCLQLDLSGISLTVAASACQLEATCQVVALDLYELLPSHAPCPAPSPPENEPPGTASSRAGRITADWPCLAELYCQVEAALPPLLPLPTDTAAGHPVAAEAGRAVETGRGPGGGGGGP
eukprot:jgi/Mesen1/7528/ME000391S06768